jgi:hypothetical protein
MSPFSERKVFEQQIGRTNFANYHPRNNRRMGPRNLVKPAEELGAGAGLHPAANLSEPVLRHLRTAASPPLSPGSNTSLKKRL